MGGRSLPVPPLPDVPVVAPVLVVPPMLVVSVVETSPLLVADDPPAPPTVPALVCPPLVAPLTVEDAPPIPDAPVEPVELVVVGPPAVVAPVVPETALLVLDASSVEPVALESLTLLSFEPDEQADIVTASELSVTAEAKQRSARRTRPSLVVREEPGNEEKEWARSSMVVSSQA